MNSNIYIRNVIFFVFFVYTLFLVVDNVCSYLQSTNLQVRYPYLMRMHAALTGLLKCAFLEPNPTPPFCSLLFFVQVMDLDVHHRLHKIGGQTRNAAMQSPNVHTARVLRAAWLERTPASILGLRRQHRRRQRHLPRPQSNAKRGTRTRQHACRITT